jgi:long-chain acyl-CoA synthetase
LTQPNGRINNLQELWIDSVRVHGDRPYLGTIRTNTKGTWFCGQETVTEVTNKTYREIDVKARALGAGLFAAGMVHETDPAEAMSPLCLYSRNREEWMVVDLACVIYGLTCVPLYDTLSLDSIPFILQQTAVPTLFCGSDEARRLAKVTDLHALKNVVFFDDVDEPLLLALRGKGLKTHYYWEIIEQGIKAPKPEPKLKPEHPFTISYTSGTTGVPKGVVLSHRSMLSAVAAFQAMDLAITE